MQDFDHQQYVGLQGPIGLVFRVYKASTLCKQCQMSHMLRHPKLFNHSFVGSNMFWLLATAYGFQATSNLRTKIRRSMPASSLLFCFWLLW